MTQCWSGKGLVSKWGNRSAFQDQFDKEQWKTWCYHTVEFGQCQYPEIDRYADAVDTLTFLLGVK